MLVTIFPNQDTGAVGDDDQQKKVECSGDDSDDAVGHRQARIAVSLGGVEHQRGNTVEQRQRHDDDKENALCHSQKMNFDG